MNALFISATLFVSILYFTVIPFAAAPLSMIPLAAVIVLYIRRGFAPALIAALLVGTYEDMHRLHIGPYIAVYGLLILVLQRADGIWPHVRHWQRVILLTALSTVFYFFATTASNAIFYGLSRSIQAEVFQSGLFIIVTTAVIPIAIELVLPYKKNERYK